VLALHSDDGEGGFPGNLSLRITYYWSDDNEMHIRYHAVSDKDTYANFTNHAYFNLSGPGANILDHRLTISADSIVASDSSYIPTGKIHEAGNDAFNDQHVKEHLTTVDDRLNGVNAFYILDDKMVQSTQCAALLSDKASGRTMTVNTSYPGIFLYTGDYLNSKHLNHNNRYCQPFEGIALECQHYPDAMNRPEFPSPLLVKHHIYNENINLKFGLI
jgi:aldose 1-epimerase